MYRWEFSTIPWNGEMILVTLDEGRVSHNSFQASTVIFSFSWFSFRSVQGSDFASYAKRVRFDMVLAPDSTLKSKKKLALLTQKVSTELRLGYQKSLGFRHENWLSSSQLYYLTSKTNICTKWQPEWLPTERLFFKWLFQRRPLISAIQK